MVASRRKSSVFHDRKQRDKTSGTGSEPFSSPVLRSKLRAGVSAGASHHYLHVFLEATEDPAPAQRKRRERQREAAHFILRILFKRVSAFAWLASFAVKNARPVYSATYRADKICLDFFPALQAGLSH
jgi:hypothetical protein